jgi:hypothetical protein
MQAIPAKHFLKTLAQPSRLKSDTIQPSDASALQPAVGGQPVIQ